MARWLVLYLRRLGGQTQFATPVWMPRAKQAPIKDVQSEIESEPAKSHSIADLARRAAMSPATSRGSSPMRSANPRCLCGTGQDRGRAATARGVPRHRRRDRRAVWLPDTRKACAAHSSPDRRAAGPVPRKTFA